MLFSVIASVCCFRLLLDLASNVVQYVLGCYFGLQCDERLANTSEKFLLLHTSPCKSIHSNRWIYVHIGSFFLNLGLDFIDSHFSSKLFFRLLCLSLLCLAEYLSLKRIKYSNDCSDVRTHVMNDVLFLTSFVRKCTPGHSTSNIFMLWGEAADISAHEGVGDTGPDDELGSPGERRHVAPIEGIK